MPNEKLTELQQIELELKQIELEEKKQALESRKLQDELARIQLGQLRSEAETRKAQKERGRKSVEKAIADLKEMQGRCNHHLGGQGASAIIYGQGDKKRETSISGIQFTDGSIMLRCNRCGKKWRDTIPNGDDFYGTWIEGVALFQESKFQQIAVVGGLKVAKKTAAA